MTIALRIMLKHPLEVAKVLRDTRSDKVGRTPPRLGALILVIQTRGDWVVRIVRLIDDIGDRQLQLMRPQPTGFVARREAESPAQIKQDVRSLRDEYVTVFEKRRGKGWVRTGGSAHQPLHC